MERLKRNAAKRLTATALGAGLLVTASTVAGCGRAAPRCQSPRASSNLFPGDPAATTDRNTWLNGFLITTEVPSDASSVVVGFRGEDVRQAWHDSFPVTPRHAARLVMSLGNGPVAFSVYIIAPHGSGTCAEAPTVSFEGPQPLSQILQDGATQPKW